MNFKRLAALYIAVFSALPLSQAYAGVAKYNRWTHAEINVCFAEKETEYYMPEMQGPKRDWKQSEKELVQKVLEEEYTPSRTGYHFVGFKDCSETENINVVVGIRSGFTLQAVAGVNGVASVGMGGRKTSYENSQAAVLLSPRGVSKTTVVHEFGHVLGLMHEHLHPNARAESGSLCPYYVNNGEFDRATLYTDFDKTSVMNYCYILGPSGRKAGLSEKDMELILDIFNDKHPFRLRHY